MDEKQNATEIGTVPLTGRGGPGRGQGRKPKIDREAVQKAKTEAEERTASDLAQEISRIEHQAERVYSVAEIETKLATKLSRAVDLMMELAEGVQVQEIDKEGVPHVYTRSPDRDALKYILDRCLGRIPERADMLPKSQVESDKLPTPEELLHQVVRMLLDMHKQSQGHEPATPNVTPMQLEGSLQ
jgi:hypothetical protein